MIPGLGAQARLFLISGVLGLGLGLCYDWGRVHRRVFPGLTLPVDILFALAFFLTLMLTAVYSRGLKLYQLLGMALGGIGYFLLFSSWLLRPLGAVLRGIQSLGKKTKRGIKKIVNFLRKLEKKLFPSWKKWGTIDVIPCSPKGRSTRRRGAAPDDPNYYKEVPQRRSGPMGRVAAGHPGKRPSLRYGRRGAATAGNR